MKRLYISLFIFALIITLGILSIYLISNANSKLYGEIESVIAGYKNGQDITENIDSLDKAFKRYSLVVGSLSGDQKIQQIEESISRLRAMYEADSDEFLAECYLVKTIAAEILAEQKPTVQRLL
ncbi:MAG: DUF4363 family protein [Oscillospiraceae bacterium]|nr:DUF4363 family protein [Oscillospiraceae bacterium]